MIVGVRALKQNASAVVSQAASGTVVTISDRGRPVAQLGPLPTTPLEGLVAGGQARPARRPIADLPAPRRGASSARTLSSVLAEDRNADRY